MLEQQPQLQVVGEAADTTGLLLLAGVKEPDLLLLDGELPGLPVENLLNFAVIKSLPAATYLESEHFHKA